jgi:hypothetical protein
MHFKGAVAALVAIATAGCASIMHGTPQKVSISNPSTLVGTTMPPYPAGLQEGGGACVGASLQPHKICQYAIGYLENSSGEHQFLVAKKAFAQSEDHTIWSITDVLDYPSVPEGYYLAIGTCSLGTVTDDTISAVIKITDSEWLEHAIWARQLNLATGQFAGIPAATVRCLNEGWGF